MNPHYPKPTHACSSPPARRHPDRSPAGDRGRGAADSTALAIADDPVTGCDPYNSTGQHVILAARLLRNRE